MSCIIKSGFKDNLLKIKIEGNATWENAHYFLNFLQKLIDEGKNKVLIDLSECNFLDSTYFGVLVELFESCEEKKNAEIYIANANESVLEEMRQLGLDQIVKFADEMQIKEFEGIDTTEQYFEDNYSRIQKAKQILKAHQRLESLNEKNKEEFKDVISSLKSFVKENSENDSL